MTLRDMDILFCGFNPGFGTVDIIYENGMLIAIDCASVERAVNADETDRAILSNLIFSDPLEYADLILYKDVSSYLMIRRLLDGLKEAAARYQISIGEGPDEVAEGSWKDEEDWADDSEDEWDEED